MKILIACEYTGVIRDAFRKLGHDAWSCDIRPTESDPTWHFEKDVSLVLKEFSWDMVVAHPPCNHLAVSGAKWFKQKRADGRQQKGVDFFMQFVGCAPRVAIENPIGVMSTVYRKPDQIVEPYWFGDPYKKPTCFWLENLPPLTATNKVECEPSITHGGKRIQAWYSNNKKMRDRTFPGMAEAIAEQWGG